MSNKLIFIATPFFLVLIILVSGCSPNAQEGTPEVSSASPNPEPTPTNPPTKSVETPQPSATPTLVPEPLSRYTLSAVLDYDTHTVQVDQQVNYVNTTGSALNELLLLVEPNISPDGFTLDNLFWEDEEPISVFSLNGRELIIPLSAALPAGNTVVFNLSFRLNLPNQTAPYGYTDRQVNLADWYPYLPPYIPGEGWLVRHDAFVGEHLSYDPAEFLVDIHLSNPVSANGLELVLAASSVPQVDGDVYRYHHTPARNFAWTVSDQYQVLETQVGTVQVKSYSFPYHPNADAAALEESAKALAVFNELFGPYPHQSLSVVEADFLYRRPAQQSDHHRCA